MTSILLLPWPSGWVERRLCQEDGESLKLTEVVCMPPELTPLLSVRAGDITWRSSASDPHLVTVGEATANDVKMRRAARPLILCRHTPGCLICDAAQLDAIICGTADRAQHVATSVPPLSLA